MPARMNANAQEDQAQLAITQGCQPPTSFLLRSDREGMIDDVIMHSTWRHLWKEYSLTPLS